MAMYQDAKGNYVSGEGPGNQYNYVNTNGQYVNNSGNSGPVYSPATQAQLQQANAPVAYKPKDGIVTTAGANPNAYNTESILKNANGDVMGIRRANGTIAYGGEYTQEELSDLQSRLGGGAMPPTVAAPKTAMSSQTMNPATGQAYMPPPYTPQVNMPQTPGLTGGNASQLPGQYSGGFAPTTPPAYTPPAPTGNASTPIPPMDAAAIQKYAADQIAAKLAAATNSANTARTTAQGDAAQSTGVLDNQLAQAIARLQASAQQAQAGITTNKERADAITKDNRLLSDDSKQRNSNPFSGKTTYDTALIGREREISDRQGLEDYNSRIGAINQDAMNQQGAIEQDINASKSGIQQGLTNLQNKITTDLQNLETSTGAERERLIREITADERQYAMALRGEDRADVLQGATLAQQKFQQEMDTFKTNYGIQKDTRDYNYQVGRDVKTDFNYEDEKNYNRSTAAANTAYNQGRDVKNDAINAANTAKADAQTKLTNERNAANDALVLRKQHIDEANYYSDKYGVQVDPKDDFQLVLDQVAGLPTVAQQTAEQQRITNQKNEAWKIVEFLGKVPDSYAELLGVPAGTETQKAKEFAADTAHKNRTASNSENNTAIAQANQQFNQQLQTAKFELDKLEAGAKKDEAITKLFDSSPLVQKRLDEDGKVIGTTVAEADKPQMRQYIATLGLTAEQAKPYFLRYGLWSGSSGN